MKRLQRSDFNYELPEELIAQQPPKLRGQSRLLIRRKDHTIYHTEFSKLADNIKENTLIVYNDSRVIPSRFHAFTSSGAKVEITLIAPIESQASNKTKWQALAKPMKKIKVGSSLDTRNQLEIYVADKKKLASGEVLELEFQTNAASLNQWLNQFGSLPLPPYIQRNLENNQHKNLDANRYQTVYADNIGSVAAPTAGLHFTDEIIEQLKERNIILRPLSLHVGAGTFLPVKTDNPDDHHMHKERYLIPKATYKQVLEHRNKQQPIICVGTTSFRSIEAFFSNSHQDESLLTDQWMETQLFIYPKHHDDIYKSCIVDGIITNFHQPESSLFMLICALVGFRHAHEIYREAIKEKYQFFSYGDACLFWL